MIMGEAGRGEGVTLESSRKRGDGPEHVEITARVMNEAAGIWGTNQ